MTATTPQTATGKVGTASITLQNLVGEDPDAVAILRFRPTHWN